MAGGVELLLSSERTSLQRIVVSVVERRGEEDHAAAGKDFLVAQVLSHLPLPLLAQTELIFLHAEDPTAAFEELGVRWLCRGQVPEAVPVLSQGPPLLRFPLCSLPCYPPCNSSAVIPDCESRASFR